MSEVGRKNRRTRMADCPSGSADKPLNKPGKKVRRKEGSEVLQTRLGNPSGAGWTM